MARSTRYRSLPTAFQYVPARSANRLYYKKQFNCCLPFAGAAVFPLRSGARSVAPSRPALCDLRRPGDLAPRPTARQRSSGARAARRTAPAGPRASVRVAAGPPKPWRRRAIASGRPQRQQLVFLLGKESRWPPHPPAARPACTVPPPAACAAVLALHFGDRRCSAARWRPAGRPAGVLLLRLCSLLCWPRSPARPLRAGAGRRVRAGAPVAPAGAGCPCQP